MAKSTIDVDLSDLDVKSSSGTAQGWRAKFLDWLADADKDDIREYFEDYIRGWCTNVAIHAGTKKQYTNASKRRLQWRAEQAKVKLPKTLPATREETLASQA